MNLFCVWIFFFRTLAVIHVYVFGAYVLGSCFRTLAVIHVYVFGAYVVGSCFRTLAVIHDSEFCVLVICVSACNNGITECMARPAVTIYGWDVEIQKSS